MLFKLVLIDFSYVFRLLTPPGTPLFPSLEMESRRTIMSQLGTPKARPTALKSRVSTFKFLKFFGTLLSSVNEGFFHMCIHQNVVGTYQYIACLTGWS